jgi:hypothetical protein
MRTDTCLLALLLLALLLLALLLLALLLLERKSTAVNQFK